MIVAEYLQVREQYPPDRDDFERARLRMFVDENADVAEFEQIVNDYKPRLHAFAQRILRNNEDAEEAVQDAFVRAYRALAAMPESQREQIPLRGWLHIITLNVVRNQLRKKRPVVVSLDAVEDPDRILPRFADRALPEDVLDRRTTLDFIEHAFSQVPPRLRATAKLRFIEGHTHREIAKTFGQPIGTVKSQVHRAAILLRQILAPAWHTK